MALIKSDKLAKEEANKKASGLVLPELPPEDEGPIKIKPIKCFNEFVALLQVTFKAGANIEVTGLAKYEEEGIVIGVGPGIPNATSRCSSQVSIGDKVCFGANGIVKTIDAKTGIYAGKRVLIVSERALLCELPPVDHVFVDANGTEISKEDAQHMIRIITR